MPVLFLVLLLLAFLCFLGAAFSVTPHPRLSLVGLGLMFWVLVPLIQAFQAIAH